MKAPYFEPGTKGAQFYSGKINGKTWVVPHHFDKDGALSPMRHSIVVSPQHVINNNKGFTPEEITQVASHIKNTHGGQEPGKLKTLKETLETEKPVKSAEEKEADHQKYRHLAIFNSRKEATLAFARRKHIIKERRVTTGSLQFNKIANTKSITYNSFGEIMKPAPPLNKDTMLKEANTLKPLTQYTYVPNRGHFVGGKKGDAAYGKHQAEYLKRKKITPVKEEHSDTFNTVKAVIHEALLKPSSNWRYGKPERRKWNWPKPIAGTPPMPNDDGQGSHDNLEPASGPKKAKNQLKEAVSRKDFQMVADLIKANPNATDRQTLANHHAHVFAQQNPRFDHARFHAAAGTQYQKG